MTDPTNNQPATKSELPDAIEERMAPAETSNQFANLLQPEEPENLPTAGMFSEENLCLPADYVTDLKVETRILSYPCDKPPKHMFFRVRPGAEWNRRVRILEVEREMGKDRYVIPMGVAGLSKVDEFIRDTMLYWVVSPDGDFRLWPIKLPLTGREISGWTQTAMKAAEIAGSKWIRLVPSSGCYKTVSAEGEFDEPVWPEQTWEEVLTVAFSDKVIASADHPVVSELRGKKS